MPIRPSDLCPAFKQFWLVCNTIKKVFATENVINLDYDAFLEAFRLKYSSKDADILISVTHLYWKENIYNDDNH